MISRGVVLALSSTVTLLFFIYGFNCYYLLAARRRYRSPAAVALRGSRPAVSVQLPIYNEKYVIGRLLDAVAGMAAAYGRDKVSIVVLDDSDDDTRDEVDRHAARHTRQGLVVEVLRRTDRAGYKAGALQAALERTPEDFIAVFDADFVPSEDFLLRTVPHLVDNPRLGVVQARWDHLNGGYNHLTRALSIGIDVHFLIEQPARYAAGCFLNFNGSCGVIRRKALQGAGGWQADTLAEDLDASYRMQLGGLQVMYLRDVACRGEVPPSMPSFVRQQGRWACGSLRTARKLLPRLLTAPGLCFRVRLQGFIHLTYYLVHPLMFAAFLLACIATVQDIRILDLGHLAAGLARHSVHVASLATRVATSLPPLLAILAIAACTVGVWFYPFVAVRAREHSIGKSLPSIVLLGLIGFGVSLSNTVEAVKALLSRRRWEFVRTPKYALQGAADGWREKKYQATLGVVGFLEIASAALGTLSIAFALGRSNYGVIPILGVYTAGFSLIAILGALQGRGKREEGSVIPDARTLRVPWGAVLLSVALQVPLAAFLGHLYDTRIFMATGSLVGSGLNPYIPRDLSSVFHDPAFRDLTTIGYPPPWALVLGLAWRVFSGLTGSLFFYNLVMKIPVIAANVGLAFAVRGVAARLGAPVTARRTVLLFILFNPLLLYTTAAWGQFDSVVALCALVGVYLLTRERPAAAGVLLALAVSLKPTALPLVPLAFLFTTADRGRGPVRFALVLAAALGVFCVVPFVVFGWDPAILLRNWSAHSSVAGGLSWLTFFEPLFGTTTIPSGLRLVGFLWVPALAAGVVLLRPRAKEGLPDLLSRGLRILLVLFLTRAWLSEPNVDLLLPFAAALWAVGRLGTTSLGAIRLGTFRLHALWVIPLVFTVFNASAPQLLFLVWPDAMTLFSRWDEKVRAARLLARCVMVLPWLALGWQVVFDGRLATGRTLNARAAGTIPPRTPHAGDPGLSVILPTYNEAGNIAETLERVESALSMVPGCSAELIVVDDGSPDGTAARAEDASRKFGNVRILQRAGRKGLASAIVDGMSGARGDLLAVLDADLQHPPESLPLLVQRIRDSAADLVVMSRYLARGATDEWSPIRRLFSGVATGLAHAILPATRPVSDPVSGYFMIRRTALEGMTMAPRGFKILPEILVRGRSLRTEEVAYTFCPRKRGRSKMGPVEMLRFAGLVLRLRREGAR